MLAWGTAAKQDWGRGASATRPHFTLILRSRHRRAPPSENKKAGDRGTHPPDPGLLTYPGHPLRPLPLLRSLPACQQCPKCIPLPTCHLAHVPPYVFGIGTRWRLVTCVSLVAGRWKKSAARAWVSPSRQTIRRLSTRTGSPRWALA